LHGLPVCALLQHCTSACTDRGAGISYRQMAQTITLRRAAALLHSHQEPLMNRIICTLTLSIGIALALAGTDVGYAADLAAEAKNAQVTDAHREMQILTSFRDDSQLHPYDLTVIVDGSTAAIGGAVESEFARDLAARLALGAAGIEHVDNRIRVDARALPQRRESPRQTFKSG
jgi:hypothetical protein